MKIIAFYLPQFHTIPENDRWWGKGFTEWTNVKSAQPLADGHYQPRIPYQKNYYNLSDPAVMAGQFRQAREYGIDGFCIYHYWFGGKLLLETPPEQMLAEKNLNFPYCFSWANESWTNAWKVGQKPKVLMEQKYGSESDWKSHFEYLLPFFKDKNYIKNNNRPLFIIYRPELIGCLESMVNCWQKLAKDAGFDGIDLGHQHIFYEQENIDDKIFRYNIEYQPAYALQDIASNDVKHPIRRIKMFLRKILSDAEKKTGIDFIYRLHGAFEKKNLKTFSYDQVWHAVLNRKATSPKSVAGAFVDWDNTPRKGLKGYYFTGASPDKFKKYISMQIKNCQQNYQNDLLFIFAWNEWAEGGYLEPDKKYGFEYLKALKEARKENGC